MQPPASDEQIARTRQQLRAEFAATLPSDTVQLLRTANGIDFDGVVLYGAGRSREAPGPGGFWQGLVEANRLWRDGPDHDGYLVLGETDMDLLTLALDGTAPVLRDKVSGDVNDRFGSVLEAYQAVLGSRL